MIQLSYSELSFQLMIWAELHVIMVTQWCFCILFSTVAPQVSVSYDISLDWPSLHPHDYSPAASLAPESSNWSVRPVTLQFDDSRWQQETPPGRLSCCHLLSVCQGQQIQFLRICKAFWEWNRTTYTVQWDKFVIYGQICSPPLKYIVFVLVYCEQCNNKQDCLTAAFVYFSSHPCAKIHRFVSLSCYNFYT